jgi:uncharacterized DUF497 family protein
MLIDCEDGNWPKCGKHGVTKAEIEALFAGEPLVYRDPEHSVIEQRFKAIGPTSKGRHVLVAVTLRPKEAGMHYRPISARYMHRDEVEKYEEARR